MCVLYFINDNINMDYDICVFAKRNWYMVTVGVIKFSNTIMIRWNVKVFKKCYLKHDDVIKWKHFPRNWPFVREIHRSPVNFPHKGQWRGALMFSLIYAWINDWVNNREAGDLRRQHGHYDVIVMGVLKQRQSFDLQGIFLGTPKKDHNLLGYHWAVCVCTLKIYRFSIYGCTNFPQRVPTFRYE